METTSNARLCSDKDGRHRHLGDIKRILRHWDTATWEKYLKSLDV